ncbi:S9 family peptidase [Amycolatopsis sp. NPDC059657]|uniref:S9 family peptidase n=1 Tax=Amycolatopsis sp. NPDC059657 TaxID=3346899 RepID=UPI00366E4688
MIFSDLDAFITHPRINGLTLSSDGTRLVVAVSTPNSKKSRYTTALWSLDPEGLGSAKRLTRSAEGESGAAFTPSGDLLFVSSRPNPEGEKSGTALWCQPADGGDARVLVALSGDTRGVVVAADGTIVFGSDLHPSAVDPDHDKEIRKQRADGGVTAILHEEFPVRYWDHDLGPESTRLFVLSGDEPRDLTGHVGRALSTSGGWDISRDGRTIVAVWIVAEPAGSQRSTLVAIDVATGERRVLAEDPEHEYDSPRISPDGTGVAFGVERRFTPEEPGDRWLGVLPLDGGEIRALTLEWDRWPHSAVWTPDGSALVAVADDNGRAPLWRIDVATGEHTRLTHDDAAYTNVHIGHNGWAYALRAAIDSPPAPVRVALDGSKIELLPSPVEPVAVPGRLEEVVTTAEDGTRIRSWLALPHDAGSEKPAPLVLQVHGGPVLSQNTWSWRANPWPLVERGFAVLLPDFALSTGYGLDFIRRGWGQWNGAPYTDLMTFTDVACARPDIDGDRTAAMGGSFGGYMANWIAGHTDRFDAIVAHASIWRLHDSAETGDIPWFFHREMTPETADAQSPHHSADAITTPMLIIHGDKDYRVPITEATRLWWDLSSRTKADTTTPHKFLYFPDEGHWILAPHHAKLWYATVLAFLSHHVLDTPWTRPALLG